MRIAVLGSSLGPTNLPHDQSICSILPTPNFSQPSFLVPPSLRCFFPAAACILATLHTSLRVS
jgi:hypothetical protein